MAKTQHYIAMSGIHGCIPQFCDPCDSRRDAVDSLAEVHELSRRQKQELRRTDSVELRRDQGAEYCEVMTCDCDDPSVHSDA